MHSTGGLKCTYILQKSKLIDIALALVLRAMIDLAYIEIVKPLFAYSGYQLHIDFHYLWISYLSIILIGLVLPSKVERPSVEIVFVMYVIVYVPFTSLFALQPGDPRYFLLVNLSFLVLFATVAFFPSISPPPNLTHRLKIFSAIALTCILYVFATVIYRGGLSFVNFDITRVYEVRWDINNKILVGLTGYLVEWCSKIFIPTFLIVGIWTGRKLVTLASSLLIVAFFAVTSAKGILFYPILALIAYYGKLWGAFRTGFLAAAIAVPVLSFITHFAFDDILVTGILLNRIYFAPTLANFQYYDFFLVHPLVCWSNTFMSAFYAYPYNDTIALILGRGGADIISDTYLNVGIFATGYMQFGVAGMLVFPFLAGISLRFIDCLAVNRMPIHVGLALSIIAGVQYVSADLTETLLSHGIFAAWLTLYLLGQSIADYEEPTGSAGNLLPQKL